MELRQYWRILVRRRKVALYTFLIALVLSALTTGYAAYSSFYQGSAVIDLQVQPEQVPHSVVDPIQAAHQNTDQAVLAVSVYATTRDFFKGVSKELHTDGIGIDWQTLGQGFDIHTGKSHVIYINWNSSNAHVAQTIVGVAAHKLLAYAQVWQHEALPGGPSIRAFIFDSPSTQRLHFTKSLAEFFLKVAAGVIAAIILAYLFEYLDTTLQDEADVQRWLGLPTLGVIPGGRAARPVRTASPAEQPARGARIA